MSTFTFPAEPVASCPRQVAITHSFRWSELLAYPDTIGQLGEHRCDVPQPQLVRITYSPTNLTDSHVPADRQPPIPQGAPDMKKPSILILIACSAFALSCAAPPATPVRTTLIDTFGAGDAYYVNGFNNFSAAPFGNPPGKHDHAQRFVVPADAQVHRLVSVTVPLFVSAAGSEPAIARFSIVRSTMDDSQINTPTKDEPDMRDVIATATTSQIATSPGGPPVVFTFSKEVLPPGAYWLVAEAESGALGWSVAPLDCDETGLGQSVVKSERTFDLDGAIRYDWQSVLLNDCGQALRVSTDTI